MAVAPVRLEEIDQFLLQETIAKYVQMLRERDTSIDLNAASVIRQLVVELQSLFGALNQSDLNKLLSSWSLLVVSQNPTLADDELVDQLVSNYLVVRNAGAFASGRLVIVLSQKTTTPIPPNAVFSANNIRYTPLFPFLGVVNPESIISDRDRLILDRADGTSAFAIEVTATTPGEKGAAKRGTLFEADPVISNATQIYAESDFVGGSDVETNEQLIQRLASGIAARSMADRSSITGLIKDKFPSVLQTSIIGFSDPEMNRDRYNFAGISTGGKVDIYARTSSTPLVVKITKTAVLDSKAAKRWRVNFTRKELSGFYRIESVLPKDSKDVGSLEVVSDVRNVDLTAEAGLFIPQINNPAHGIFSAFQTATVKFLDPAVNTDSLTENSSTIEYDFYVLSMPALWDIQSTILSNRAFKDPAGDYLLRAPIPCMVSIGMLIKYDPRYMSPDVIPIKNSVSSAVNSVDFSAPNLSASRVVDAVRQAIPEYAYVELPIDMRGKVILPNGEDAYLVGDKFLTIPDYLDYGVSRRTTAFFLSPDDVEIQLLPAAVKYT